MNDRLEGILQEVGADFRAGRLNCAESVLVAVTRYFDIESDCVPRIATPFGGGMGSTQRVCGALTGGIMALGLRYGREAGGDKGPSYQRTQRLLAHFGEEWGAVDCRALIELELSNPVEAQAFRQPGGKHQTFCERAVPEVCRYLVAMIEADA